LGELKEERPHRARVIRVIKKTGGAFSNPQPTQSIEHPVKPEQKEEERGEGDEG